MAFDGVTVSAIVSELKKNLTGGRIYKIYQPEVDELCLVVKNRTEQGNTTSRLVISADASLPLIYLTGQIKENPSTAPNFCMLLRKHIGNARILSVTQPNFERIVEMQLEHLDEMGDLCQKKLIVEIMGKHSNIIFTDADGTIIDSIKHISHQVSSVREVLPGRTYVYPPAQEKENPLDIDINYFMNHVLRKPVSVTKAIYTSLTGLSPVIANEICYRAGVDGGMSTAGLSMQEQEDLASLHAEGTDYLFKSWTDASEVTLTHDYVIINTDRFSTYALYRVTQPKTYTVVWKDGDGNILKTETVEEGASATPPEGTPTKTPTKDYTYTFEGWDQDYTNVTKDMVILAWFYSTKRDDTTEDPGTTENPGTTEQPGTTEGPKAPNANVTPGGNGANGGQNTSKNPVKYTYMGATGSPQTGDATPIVLLVCAIVFAGAGIVVTIKKRKSF